AYRGRGAPLTLVVGPGEVHGTFEPGPRKLVIDLIEAIFRLRVTAAPALAPIDEQAGRYWLGDNYTQEIGPYPMLAGKSPPTHTSFLPSEALARQWQMVAGALPPDIQIEEGGTCSTCYPHPPGEPGAPMLADAGVSGDGASDGGPVATGGAGGGSSGGGGTGGGGGAPSGGGSGGTTVPDAATADAPSSTDGAGDSPAITGDGGYMGVVSPTMPWQRECPAGTSKS